MQTTAETQNSDGRKEILLQPRRGGLPKQLLCQSLLELESRCSIESSIVWYFKASQRKAMDCMFCMVGQRCQYHTDIMIRSWMCLKCERTAPAG